MMFGIIKIIAMHKKQSMTISYDAFKAVSLRSGIIVKVEEFPRLKHLLLMPRQILTPKGMANFSPSVTVHYTPETFLLGQIVGRVNLAEKNISGCTSQFLLVGFGDASGAIVLITVDPKVPNGQKMC